MLEVNAQLPPRQAERRDKLSHQTNPLELNSTYRRVFVEVEAKEAVTQPHES